MTANGFALQQPVANRLCQLTGGLPGGVMQVRETPVKLYHSRNVPNNGVAELRFFNETRQRGITNLDQPNSIPSNYGLALSAIRAQFLYGIDRDGSRATVFAGGGAIEQTALSRGGAGAVITDTLVDDVWKAHETMRALMESAIVVFSVANREVFEVKGLTSFPDGRGLNATISSDTAMTNAAAAASISHILSHVNNGVPMLANAFTFLPPYPLPAGQTFDLRVIWPTVVDFQQATIGPLVGATAGNPAGTLTMELEGTLVGPGSN